MESSSLKKIVFIIPTLTPGGAERVISVLANNFVKYKNFEIHIVLLVGGSIFFDLSDKIHVHQPPFYYKNYSRIVFTIFLGIYLRKTLKKIRPDFILSFEGRFNSFVLINAIGLKSKCFISDRSSPLYSYGIYLDFINKFFYPNSYGIISQTNIAKEKMLQKITHNNISVIGNPIKSLSLNNSSKRKNIILNVGRFISTKNQELLLNYFYEIENEDWELWYVGEGPLLESVKQRTIELDISSKVKFLGNQKNIEKYYTQSKIFAFTSTSEGFPNALGEAMGAGCACISFDCISGPSDLITNNVDGILIKTNQHEDFKTRLMELMHSEFKINYLGTNAIEKITTNYSEELISYKYFDFITTS
jgi:GalNAc-alpha-(1->4)-GalNAc-alpha-(1->3)-diNAcBac-PP-undecaprenol alpha-1,4-N-acetyl-D-galactosaminyltransferase